MNNPQSVSLHQVAGYLREAKRAILADEYPVALREPLLRKHVLNASDWLDSALANPVERGAEEASHAS